MEISSHWRAGFEIEVVLGALDDQRFTDYESDPMDMASPAYCQAVAKALSRMTGRSWTAPIKAKSKPGYYVLPEYDLDTHPQAGVSNDVRWSHSWGCHPFTAPNVRPRIRGR